VQAAKNTITMKTDRFNEGAVGGAIPNLRLNQTLRYTLVALFGSCAVWLLAYCIPLLNPSREHMPGIVSWAWSLEVTNIYYTIAPATWIGMDAAIVYGTPAEIIWDVLSALVYLIAAILLLVKEEEGTSVASSACFLNIASLFSQVLIIILSPTARSGSRGVLVFAFMIAVLLCYAALGIFLGKLLLRMKRAKGDGRVDHP
jgi:hypothetical protein